MKRFTSGLPDPSAPLSCLPGRNLERHELEEVVEQLERHDALWRGLVGFSDEHRHFAALHRDAHLDVWLLCWTTANDTGWHDHDISSGAVRVVHGALNESAPRIGGAPAVRVVPAGHTLSFAPDHIHRLTASVDRSISIHAYSPALVRLGQYSIDEDGVLRRQPVSYLDELRAFEAPVAA